MSKNMTYEQLTQQALECAETIRKAKDLLDDTHLALEAIELNIKCAREQHKSEFQLTIKPFPTI